MKSQTSSIPAKIERKWVEVDASALALGRTATKIANILRGKNKRSFTPHIDGGDYVVAVNVHKLKLTGRKIEQKQYHHYSGYPGGLRTKQLKHVIADKPEDVLRKAVFNMIDDNKLRKFQMRRLKLVAGAQHKFNIDTKA